ncbi:MAG: hypothetical protein FJ154_06750 [Gammaproteobacteria bacterium]|nr:hypothetical protein [Gammaproteobacteria bacterium]
MNRTRALAIFLALIGWPALIAQLFASIAHRQQQGHSVAYGVFMYAGYFTILTNLFCTIVATAHSKNHAAESRWNIWREPWVITSAAMTIAMVGLVFHLLLRHQYQPTGVAALTNLIHHYIVPIVFLVFWWLAVPRASVAWTDISRLSAYPAAYFVYIAARGEISGVYPYPFFDVPTIGYGQAALNAAGIATVFVLAGVGLIAAKR